MAAAIALWFFCAWLARPSTSEGCIEATDARAGTKRGKTGEERRKSGRTWRSMVYRGNKRVNSPRQPPLWFPLAPRKFLIDENGRENQSPFNRDFNFSPFWNHAFTSLKVNFNTFANFIPKSRITRHDVQILFSLEIPSSVVGRNARETIATFDNWKMIRLYFQRECWQLDILYGGHWWKYQVSRDIGEGGERERSSTLK